MNKQQLGIRRVALLQRAALAARDGNHRAAAWYTRKARHLAMLAGYRPSYRTVAPFRGAMV